MIQIKRIIYAIESLILKYTIFQTYKNEPKKFTSRIYFTFKHID